MEPSVVPEVQPTVDDGGGCWRCDYQDDGADAQHVVCLVLGEGGDVGCKKVVISRFYASRSYIHLLINL